MKFPVLMNSLPPSDSPLPATSQASESPPASEQVVAALIGLFTGGPLGAASAWGWFRFLKGKWGPWALFGIFMAPICIVLQIGFLAAIAPSEDKGGKPLTAESSPAKGNSDNPPATQPVQQSSVSGVNMENFKELQTGMTYEQVAGILGQEGEEMSRSEIAGTITVLYTWKADDFSNMNVTFQNNALVSKAQLGLR